MRWLPLIALCFACNGKDEVSEIPTESDTDTDTDTDTDVPCTATVVAVEPADGDDLIAVDATVTAEFSEPVTEEQVTLTVDGVAGTLDLAGDGLTATFTPDADLDIETVYAITASVCDSTLGASFTTAGAGVDPASLEGRTYGIRWDSLTFTEPDPIAIAFIPIDITHILVAIQSYDAATDDLIAAAATATEDGVDLVIDCVSALTDVEADFSANPTFQVGPENFVIGNDPADPYDDYIIEDLQITGTFSEDLSQIVDPHVQGAVDVRPFGVSCGDFSAFANCLPCDDGELECAEIDARAPFANDLTADADLIGTCGL